MATITKEAGFQAVKELTVRGIILGGLITLVFTAANVYLGLKVGLTFASSIRIRLSTGTIAGIFSPPPPKPCGES